MKNSKLDLQSLMLTAAIGLAVAVAAGLGLAGLSTPAAFSTRLENLDLRLDELQRLSKLYAGAGGNRTDAICGRPAVEEADVLRQVIMGDAAALGLTVVRAEVSPAAQRPNSPLIPLSVRLEANGPYEGALTLLAHLQKFSPEVFADSMDLTSKTTSVTLAFSGRAFCAS